MKLRKYERVFKRFQKLGRMAERRIILLAEVLENDGERDFEILGTWQSERHSQALYDTGAERQRIWDHLKTVKVRHPRGALWGFRYRE